MIWLKANWQGIVLGAIAAVLALYFTGHAQAADLGGNCCADLEERISELEATTARKGNRKVSLTVTGQVFESVLWWDDGTNRHVQVQSNPNKEAVSRFQFVGEATLSPTMKAGYVLQIGVGGIENAFAMPMSGGLDTNGVWVRESYVYLTWHDGKIGVGKLETATYDLMDATAGVNTGLVWQKLSLSPIVGGPLGSALDIFNGGITDAVKIKSPSFAGFWVEGSWASAVDPKALGFAAANGDAWDVALKYDAEPIQNLKVNGRIGYRDGLTLDTGGIGFLGSLGGANVQDIKVWGGSFGVLHMPTGAFLNASYGNLDYSTLVPGASHITGWAVQGGVQEHWIAAGKTTVFGDYEQVDLGITGSKVLNIYGLGVVQELAGGAVDLGLVWKRYDDPQFAAIFSALEGGAAATGPVDTVMGTVGMKF